MRRAIFPVRLLAALPPLLGTASCEEATPASPLEDTAAAGAPGAHIASAEPRVHGPGELGHARDYTLSVEATRDCAVARPFEAPPGKVKVGVLLVLEGISAREVPSNAFYASLHARDGSTYAPTLAGCEPALPALRLTLGKKARGYVTFEIPVGARAFELRYAPIIIGAGPEELRFSVTR